MTKEAYELVVVATAAAVLGAVVAVVAIGSLDRIEFLFTKKDPHALYMCTYKDDRTLLCADAAEVMGAR
jgi:hypothetical protein